MNSAKNQINAYATNHKEGTSQRGLEAQALLNCASKLYQVQRPDTSYLDYSDVIRLNQRLWTVFQASLTEADNPLPPSLKTILLNLSIYIDKMSMRALAEQNPALLNSLIEINRNIAAGLNTNPSAATTEAPPVQLNTNTAPASFSASV
jgi:flagellar protein FlaF